MKHIKIGVDMDDVLFDINPAVIRYFNQLKGTTHPTEDVKDFYLENLFGITRDEMEDVLRGFTESDHHDEAGLIQGAKEGLDTLRAYDLILITARHGGLRERTLMWLEKHFPSAFSSVHLLGIYGGGLVRTKGELAQDLGIKVFIEDSLSNAKNIAKHGIPVVLLDKPWNQENLPATIHRVKTWEEVVAKIEELTK